MDSQDLRSVMTTSEVPPAEEAAKNINRSKVYEINPDSYSEMKSELEPPVIANERIPANVDPIVQDFTKQSKQHLALAQHDIPKLNETVSRFKYYQNKLSEIPSKTRERNELARKEMFSELTEEEEEKLQDYNAALTEMSAQQPEDMGDVEKWVGDVGAAAVDIARSYKENIGLVGGITGGATAVGATTGFIGTALNPLGALIGAKVGFGSGLATAAAVVPAVDAFMETSASVSNDLKYGTKEDGTPLDIPKERRVVAANAVAAISAVAAYGAGKVLANNNPYLRKFLDPTSSAKYLISNPALMAKLDIIGGLVKSGGAEGVEEFVQQYAETIGTELAKVDGSEESFMNALDNIASAQTLKDAAYSATVGFGAGAGFASATNVPMYGMVKSEYEQMQKVSQQKKEVLETQNMLMEANATLSSTKLQELAPEEARSFKQKLFDSLGVEPNLWFNVDDLKAFANSPEKGQKIKNIIDLNPEMVKLAQDTNTPIQLSKADVLDIMTEFPDITEWMRLNPEGQNPSEVRNEAKSFSDNLTKAEQKRTQLMELLGVVEDNDKVQGVLREALGDLKESPYFANEAEYLDRTPMKEIEGFITKEEAETFNTDHLAARLEVAKSLNEDVDSEFNTKSNKIVKQIGDVPTLEVDENGQKVAFDFEQVERDLAVVESFMGKKGKNQHTKELKAEHLEKGNFSPYAIDPRYLSDDLRPHLVTNQALKDRGAFVMGGITPDEAATYLGVESGDKLLKILANTPDRKTLQKRKQQRKIEIKNQVDQALKTDRLEARDNAFTKLTTIHLREMEFMRTKAWPTLKRGIIKIAGKVPTIEELNTRAKDTVSKLKIRDLNPTQFKQGETRSQRTAVKQFLNSEVEQAFKNKERAALNSELMKETVRAKDRVAKAQRFWKKMQNESSQQELKDAGYWDVMNEFMNLYKLDGAVKSEKEQASFNKWVKQQAALGKPVPVIPKRLNNTQASYKDLTTEQYQAITEFGEYIFHQAKTKNKLMEQNKARKEFETQEHIADQFDKLAKAHIDFDPTRAKREEKSTKDGDFITNVQNKVKTLMSSVNNTKNIVMELDNHKLGGFFYKTLVEPLVRAQTAKRQENFELREYFKKTIEEYGGQKKYNEMVNERVEIAEFAMFDELNNGNMRKIDLMRMMAVIGDPDGRVNIENYRDASGKSLDFDTVMKVLDAHLTEADAVFVQNFFVNPYKRFTKASADLHKRTTGIDADMVEGAPFVFKGKVYEGGYQPLEYQRLPDHIRAEKELQKMQEMGVLDESGFFASMRAAEMTKQDRMKDRTGSQRPMKLDFENHFKALEEIIHDLHFREPGIDMMKIMKQPSNVENIKGVVGSKKFVLLLDSIKDVVSHASDKDAPVFRDQAAIVNSILGFGKQLHAIKAISLNVFSAAIQWDSLMYMPLRSGPKTFMYMSKTVAKLTANLTLGRYDEMVKIASEILPDIKHEMDSIDDSLNKSMDELIPHGNVFFKNYKKLGKGVTRMLQMRKKAIESSFILLREADKLNKVIATISLSDQFLNGDIEGYSKEMIAKMSDSEKKETMQKVVKQIVDLSLTASSRLDKTALEKNKAAQLFVNYWTDRRSRLNTMAAQINKSRKSYKAGNTQQAVNQLMFLGVVAGLSSALQNQIRGNEDEESMMKKLQKIDDPSDAAAFALEGMYDFAITPVHQMAQSVPGVDAVLYAYESTIDYGKGRQVRPVSLPHIAVLTDLVAGAVAARKAVTKGKVNKKDRKALVTIAGYGMGGAPTNVTNKVIDIIGSRGVKRNLKDFKEEVNRYHDMVDEYIETFKDDPESQEFIEDLKEDQKNVPRFDQPDTTEVIPEGTKDDLKTVLSGGDWTKYDEDTGAIGVYQFTEERWNELMLTNPDLGLTENGRIAKDSSQQEKAMEVVIDEAGKSLMAYELEVSKENILGVHKFGFDNFAAIIEANDSKKLSEVIGEEAKNPVFKNFKTVGQVKKYLSGQFKALE